MTVLFGTVLLNARVWASPSAHGMILVARRFFGGHGAKCCASAKLTDLYDVNDDAAICALVLDVALPLKRAPAVRTPGNIWRSGTEQATAVGLMAQ